MLDGVSNYAQASNSWVWQICDTGVVFVTRVWRESKVIRLLSIIHSGIILDLVCGFGGSVGEDVSC